MASATLPLHYAWLFLLAAGLLEIGWPVGIKIAQEGHRAVLGIAIAIVFMGLSGFCLWMAQKAIPLGTAYAVWTGIGAAGTFIVGVVFFHDPAGFMKWVGVALIIAGVVTLKLASGAH
ncbi:MAG: DMT family transporter [Puniceicoccales bacterium]